MWDTTSEKIPQNSVASVSLERFCCFSNVYVKNTPASSADHFQVCSILVAKFCRYVPGTLFGYNRNTLWLGMLMFVINLSLWLMCVWIRCYLAVRCLLLGRNGSVFLGICWLSEERLLAFSTTLPGRAGTISPFHIEHSKGKTGICFGTMHQDEQQFTNESQEVLVRDGVVKTMTESFRNSRESLLWCSSHSGGAVFSHSCVRWCKMMKSLTVISPVLVVNYWWLHCFW